MSSRLIWDNLVIYSLQIGLLVGLAGFVPSLLRLRLPAAKLAYWHLLLAACLLLPLVRPWRQKVIAAADVQIVTSVAEAVPADPSARPNMPRSEIAILLLAAGVLVRLGWLGLGFRRLRTYRLNSQPLGLHHGCTLRLSDEISSPVTFGWRKPIVLLPATFPEFGKRIQEAILCHEMLHVERRDWPLTVLEEVVRAIFWFHPAIWWLLGQIQLAREQAVDRLAIERTNARDEYVDALLAIAGAKPQLDLALAPLFLRKRHLKQRVISIFKEVRMSKTRLFARLAMGLVILAAACWFVTGTFPLAAAPQLVNDAAGVTVDLGAATLLHRAPVSYPESARQHGVAGTVMLETTLDGRGNVTDARVVSGPDELRRPALQSVLQWHFSNTAAGTRRQVGITFQLPEPALQSTIAVPPGEVRLKPAVQPGAAVEHPAGGAKVPSAAVQNSPEEVSKTINSLRDLALTQAFQTSRNGSSTVGLAGRTLKGISILGLSDQNRNELLARLPVREGDTLTEGSRDQIAAAVNDFDEHLSVSLTSNNSGPGEAGLTIAAPDFAIRIGSVVSAANLIRQPRPLYPPEAKAQRIQGTVRLSATIGKDGTIKHLDVISGDAMLTQAAVDAVQQWVYKPTLLNGDPVEVKTTIDVNFTLSQ